MKITKRFMPMLLLACSVSMIAVAQTGTSSDSSMKNDSMGKQMKITGCVSEKDGKYMLMDKKHPDGVELMSSEDLKPHVGHKVSVMGMMEGKSGMSDKSMSDDSMKKDNMGMSGMKVSSMKMVSDHCDMPGNMMNK